MTGPAYRTISDVAEIAGVPQHVLRFWETKFPQIQPLKRGGNRRYYRPEDVAVVQRIARLLHVEGYTIRGAQKLLGDSGPVSAVAATDIALEAVSARSPPAPARARVSPPAAPGTAALSLGAWPSGALRDTLAAARDDLAAAVAAARELAAGRVDAAATPAER